MFRGAEEEFCVGRNFWGSLNISPWQQYFSWSEFYIVKYFLNTIQLYKYYTLITSFCCCFFSPEREPPRPKPRQRTLRLKPCVTETSAEETASHDLNCSQTSCASAPLPSDTSSNIAVSKLSSCVCFTAQLSALKLQCKQVLFVVFDDSGQMEITPFHPVSASPLQIWVNSRDFWLNPH